MKNSENACHYVNMSCHVACVQRGTLRVGSVIMQEVRDYASVAPASDEMLFSEIYHSLIHSQSLETLLSLDDTYGADMHKLLDERDSNISSIEKRSVSVLFTFTHISTFLALRNGGSASCLLSHTFQHFQH